MKLLKYIAILAMLTACGDSQTSHDHYYDHGHSHSNGHSHSYDHNHSHSHDHDSYSFFVEGDHGYINIYSARHFLADEEIFRRFTYETGIGINVIHAHGGQVVERLRIEGPATPAHLIIADDGGILSNAASRGLLQPVVSDTLELNVPTWLRDENNYWYGLSYRARVLAVTEQGQFENYQDLMSDYANVLLRPGNHLYNVSLLASIIDIYGFDEALEWAAAVSNNRARTPQGNDRDQAGALYAGIGNVALVNSYYVGLLRNSNNPAEVQVGENIEIVFPNQTTTGTHINISGMAIPAYSTNVEGAIAFMEFITGEEMQTFLANTNYEFPVNPLAVNHPMFENYLPFARQEINFTALYENHIRAVEIMNIVGW